MKHWIAFVCASIIAASGLAASGQHAARGARGAAAPYDVMEKTIEELQAAMAAGRVTSRQLVEAYLARIGAYDRRGPDISAFITLNPRALDTADGLDRELLKADALRGARIGVLTPPFTPALQNGRAPPSMTFVADATSIRVKFSYDPVEGRLRDELAPEAARSGRPLGRPEDEILYATIHRGVTGETGPALFTLRSGGTSAPVRALQLSRRDQSDLMQRHLYLLVATNGNPSGIRTQLKLP